MVPVAVVELRILIPMLFRRCGLLKIAFIWRILLKNFPTSIFFYFSFLAYIHDLLTTFRRISGWFDLKKCFCVSHLHTTFPPFIAYYCFDGCQAELPWNNIFLRLVDPVLGFRHRIWLLENDLVRLTVKKLIFVYQFCFDTSSVLISLLTRPPFGSSAVSLLVSLWHSQ